MSVEPGSDKITSGSKAGATDNISDAERELYGGRLRYDQSYVRHEGPLTRLKFGHCERLGEDHAHEGAGRTAAPLRGRRVVAG
ncbi:hypothetical protein [Streptomyces sp. NRRL S-340]|uniref:hypothetical protein n=1 Tax=Streptomyces sp. NRRL S-340 TaxID=1463901 RepID=UPI00131A75B3|nr:hypothetical protein [Streptomyces sp. NRRL S-340]